MSNPVTTFNLYRLRSYEEIHRDADYSIGPFKDAEQQHKYFENNNYRKLKLVDYSYQRIDLGVVELEIDYETARQFDYMSFQNEEEGKRYFAFITRKPEYVSDTVTRIYYEIDDIQTYFGTLATAKFGYCFVEREHVEDDNIINILDDYQVSGNYTYETYKTYKTPFNYLIAVSSTKAEAVEGFNPDDFLLQETLNDGVLNTAGAYVYAIDIPADEALRTAMLRGFVAAFVGTGETINLQAVYQAYIPNAGIDFLSKQGLKVIKNAAWIPYRKGFSFPSSVGNDSYTPMNNKAYTYPYCYDFVSNNVDQEVKLMLECFPKDTVNQYFDLYVTLYPQPAIALTPKQYNNNPEGTIDYDNMCVISRQTQLAVRGSAADEFKKQNGQTLENQLLHNTMQGLVGAIGAIAGSPTIGSMAVNAAKSTYSDLKKYEQGVIAARSGPQPVRGTNTPSTFLTAADFGISSLSETESPQADRLYGNGFVYGRKTISAEEMKVIDFMWQKFGYPVRITKLPDINTRTTWNYLKTDGCVVSVDAPSDVEERIAAKFDAGFTFWHVYEDENGIPRTYIINNYTQANTPVETV